MPVYGRARPNSSVFWCGFDLPDKEEQLKKLTKESERTDLWEDPAYAQRVMKRFSSLRAYVDSWGALRQRVADALALAELEDEALADELTVEVEELERILARRELSTMLSGPHDEGDALLAIHAGAGGTDAHDWAQMLQRMYLRWAEKRGFDTEILDQSDGEEAGIKSTTIAIDGNFAYGYLRSEKGVHRLVRLSPYDAASRRHTSFALVEILPQVEDDTEIEINTSDLRIDTYRSSGAGGQNVQKNDTAVRITHLPTGIVVTCQNERSQTQNRENAMRVLRARLLEVKQQEQQEQMDALRGEYQKAEWGSQIRSYVLHPYQMVKDHRTNFEDGNAQGVLDGSIDGFVEAFLRSDLNKVRAGRA